MWRKNNSYNCSWNALKQVFEGPGCVVSDSTSWCASLTGATLPLCGSRLRGGRGLEMPSKGCSLTLSSVFVLCLSMCRHLTGAWTTATPLARGVPR